MVLRKGRLLFWRWNKEDSREDRKGERVVIVRDLYVNTDENQEFIMWFESEPSKACYKGKLENCSSELMYMLVDKFRAIDFNIIEVILIG